MKVRADLSGRFRQLRIEKGLTQQQVAEPKYTPAYVSTIESGKRYPSEAALDHFAQSLGVSVSELVSGVPSSFDAEAELELQEGWRALYLGDYAAAKKRFRSIAKRAESVGRAVTRARAVVGGARCLERQGQTSDALQGFSDALELLAEAPLPAKVEAIAGMARCHQMLGDTRLAAHLLETYLLRLERANMTDPTALMRTYASLVWPYMELELHEKAREVAHEALKLQTLVESPEEIAGMHLNVARVLLNEGRADDALESLRKAEGIYEDLNWRTELARAQTNRGMVFVSSGELEAGRAELVSALKTFHEVGFIRGEARTLNELARVERLMGNTENAEGHGRQALELLSDMDAKPELALAYRELGLSLKERSPDDARRYLREAITTYSACGESLHEAETHRLLGDLLDDLGQSDSACAQYKAGLLAMVGETS